MKWCGEIKGIVSPGSTGIEIIWEVFYTPCGESYGMFRMSTIFFVICRDGAFIFIYERKKNLPSDWTAGISVSKQWSRRKAPLLQETQASIPAHTDRVIAQTKTPSVCTVNPGSNITKERHGIYMTFKTSWAIRAQPIGQIFYLFHVIYA